VTWTFCWIETGTGVRYVRSPLSPSTVMMMAAPGFMRPPTRPTQTRCDDVQAMLALDPEFFSRLAHSQSPKCGYLPHCDHLFLSLPPFSQCHGQPTCCWLCVLAPPCRPLDRLLRQSCALRPNVWCVDVICFPTSYISLCVQPVLPCVCCVRQQD
jgi:hypothetical protein